jgi:hypothetical protein
VSKARTGWVGTSMRARSRAALTPTCGHVAEE